jgi:hypothetical protein
MFEPNPLNCIVLCVLFLTLGLADFGQFKE